MTAYGPTQRYTPSQLQALAGCINRQKSGKGRVSGTALGRQLLDLLSATGHAHDGSAGAIAFHEACAKQPSHKDLAKQGRRIAAANHPLESISFTGIVVSEIRGHLRHRWSGNIRTGKLDPQKLRLHGHQLYTPADIADIRAAAAAVALNHENWASKETSRKHHLDTLLIELADIFASHTRFKWSRFELAKAEHSTFIQFAHVAFTPFFHPTEVSANALHLRWKRLISAETKAAKTPRGRPKSLIRKTARKGLKKKLKSPPKS